MTEIQHLLDEIEATEKAFEGEAQFIRSDELKLGVKCKGVMTGLALLRIIRKKKDLDSEFKEMSPKQTISQLANAELQEFGDQLFNGPTVPKDVDVWTVQRVREEV